MSLNERNMGPLLLAIPRPLSSFLLMLSNLFLPFLMTSLAPLLFLLLHQCHYHYGIQVLLFSSSRIHFYFRLTIQFHFIVFFFRWISFVFLFHGIKSYVKTDSLINGTNCCPRNRVTCDNIWSPCHCTTKNYTICIK